MSQVGENDQGTKSEPGAKKTQALEQIRRKIFGLKHNPGSFISAKGLALELGVSRTTVTAAMQTLACDGLIEWFGGAGARIRTVNDGQFVETLTLRRAIETEVGFKLAHILNPPKEEMLDALIRESKAALSAASDDGAGSDIIDQLDRRFHVTLATVAETSRAEAYLGNLIDHGRLFNFAKEERPARMLAEHSDIVRAIKGRNRDRIREAFTTHFVATIRRRVPDLTPLLSDLWGQP